MRIGVISDTHGFLDPRVLRLFAGVQHILHAGDIGPLRLILELEAVAPVTAVLGNTDSGLRCRETEVVVLEARKFLVHHIVDPHGPSSALRDRLDRDQPDVVVFGHTHRQCYHMVGKRLFLNPGYSGRPRFNQPRSVAVLDSHAGEMTCQFHPLPD